MLLRGFLPKFGARPWSATPCSKFVQINGPVMWRVTKAVTCRRRRSARAIRGGNQQLTEPNGDAGNRRLVYWIRRQESDLRGLRSERSWDASNPSREHRPVPVRTANESPTTAAFATKVDARTGLPWRLRLLPGFAEFKAKRAPKVPNRRGQWKGRDSNPRPRHYERSRWLNVTCKFINLPRGARCNLALRSTTEHNRVPQISRTLRQRPGSSST